MENVVIDNGGVVESQIEQWKAKYRIVQEVTITDGDEQHKGYFKRPDMETLAAVNKLSKTDEIKAANVLFENCWLGGSGYIAGEAVLKMAAIGRLNELMMVTSTEIKNL